MKEVDEKFKSRGERLKKVIENCLEEDEEGAQICDLQRKSKFQSQDGRFQQIVMTTIAKPLFHCALARID